MRRNIILLHGAIGSSQQLISLKEILEDELQVILFDFPGHGGTEMPRTFSIELFANSVVQYMNENNIATASIFGYSMGGYVGMYLAKHFPGRIDNVITLATKYHWDENVSGKEIKMLVPEVIEQKIPAFAETLQHRHTPNDWKEVLSKTAEMLVRLGKKNCLELPDYRSIHQRCLMMIGEKDKMVSIEETEAVYQQLPNGRIEILPATPHPIEQVDIELLSKQITSFLNG